jgi:hypothetical protein
MSSCISTLCPLSYSTTRVVEIRCAPPLPAASTQQRASTGVLRGSDGAGGRSWPCVQ